MVLKKLYWKYPVFGDEILSPWDKFSSAVLTKEKYNNLAAPYADIVRVADLNAALVTYGARCKLTKNKNKYLVRFSNEKLYSLFVLRWS
jgi:hypothetical protein